MQKTLIHVLSAHVANKIAAGEVVERPASVARELVENAFDAGADRVDVEIAAGGRKLIAVSDNGSGMGRDDAILCLERHATSKISDVDDIEHISTLGFRGEAVPAIASVSRFRLCTCRTGDREGTEISVTAGRIDDVREAGCPAGTRVEVRDLFFNVPARRKFLRTNETETGHVRDVFITESLSHPGASMSLKADGALQYNLPAAAGIEDRIRDIFGSGHLAGMARVESAGGSVKVTGMAGLPSLTRPDRKEQYFFVNGRATSAAVLNHALREAYHTLIPQGRQPIAFIFIEIDPGQVDVNVHPAKKEVRFRNTSEVRDAVIDAVSRGLSAGKPASAAGQAEQYTSPPASGPVQKQAQFRIADLPEIEAFRYPGRPNSGSSASLPDIGPEHLDGSPPRKEQGGFSRRNPWAWCRVLGQLAELYVVLETDDGYVIMDPHAAHERILFEKFMKDLEKKKIQVQNLLIPETVELVPSDAQAIRKSLEVLREMGFGIAEFGQNTFVVDAVPSSFSEMNMKEFLVQSIADLEASGARRSRGRWREESIAQAACKTAVKARDRLSLQEVERLVIELANTDMPYTCPHGRPTLIYTPMREINRRFGRE